ELAVGAHVVATFSCSGEVDAKFMEVAAKKNPQPPWLVDAPAAKGHPDANDLKMVVRMLEELDLP
ncbi:MAG: flavodoxin family protein, partial [Proteobacteria bacterium]|nr:flavodoxin family protein [Pseudomonadota bacterium]